MRANGIPDIAPLETRHWNGALALTRVIRLLEELREATETGQVDAGSVQDHALQDFFAETERHTRQMCAEAEQMLADRRDSPVSGRDIVEESSMESFPSSDPPAW